MKNTKHQADSLPRMFKCSISQTKLKYIHDTKTSPMIWNLAYFNPPFFRGWGDKAALRETWSNNFLVSYSEEHVSE